MIKVATGTIPDIKELKDAINKKWNTAVSSPMDSKIPQMYVQDAWSVSIPSNDIINKNNNIVNSSDMQNNEEYDIERIKNLNKRGASTVGGRLLYY